MNQWLQFLRNAKRGRGGGHGSPPPPPPPAPVADFTGTPLSGTAPLAVTFTDTSTNSPNAWSWDFGDGDTSVAQNPVHTFINPGSYNVALEAFNSGGSDTETKSGYITVTGAVTRLRIEGTNFIDIDDSVWVPYGLSDGNFELWHAGDEAADAAMGSTCLRTVVREYGTYGVGFRQDMQEEGQPGNLKPAYLSDIVDRLTASHAAGMYNFIAMDSNKGQGAEASGGNDFFSGSAEGLRQRGLFIDSAVYLADTYGDLIEAMEPLVEPSSAVVPNKETLWAYQEEFMTAVLAVAPHMLFAIGPRDYAAGNVANAINPAWLDPDSPFYGHVFITCNFLNNLSMNVSQRAARAVLVDSTRTSKGVPVWINQLATHNSTDPDDINLDATMTLLDQAAGGYIGYNYWERVSPGGGDDGLYFLTDTGDPESARDSHPDRITLVSNHFNHVTSGTTWGDLNLLAANMGPNYEYYTRVWVNLNNSGRAWCPSTNSGGYGYENVTLKSNGYPAAGTTSTRVFMSDLQAEDADVYHFECTGNFATGSATITQAGGGTLSARSHNEITNKTTCTITITGAGDNIIALKFNNVPADFGDVKLHPSAYPLTTTQKFRTDALEHFSMFKTLRFMDWLETNGSESAWAEVGNPDTDWATSRAAAYGSGWRHQHSLGACFDFFIAHGGQNIWTNIPAKATDAYIESYVADGLARLPAGKKWFIEFGNELWNNVLGESTAYQDIRTAAFATAGVKAGVDITSLSRTSNVITAGVGTGHGKVVGNTIYVRQKNNLFAEGSKTITAVTSSTISWADTGSNGSIVHTDDNTFIFLNPTHTLCRPLTSYHQPENPTPNYVRIRYMLQRARRIWTAINNGIAVSDVKVLLGTWMASLFNYVPCLAWAAEEYGDLSWLYAAPPALYMEPENMNSGAGGINSVDDVFTQLDANAVITLGRALRWNNLMLTWGMKALGYEAGPHTHGGDGTSTPYIVAAHSDDRMRLRLKSWWQSWLNRGGDELCFFHAGITKQPTSGNSTWPITYGAIADDSSSVKFAAFSQLNDEVALAEQESGVNYGTIRYIDVLPESGAFLQQTSNWLLINPAKTIPSNGISIRLVFDSAGTKTIALDACTNGGGTVPFTATLDGDLIWSGNLPSGSVFSIAPGEAFSTTVSVPAAGSYIFTFNVATSSRADWVGLYRCRTT